MTMTTDDLETAAVIDVDSHILEPADLWTSRLPDRMRDLAPHVVWDDDTGEERWQVGDMRLNSSAKLAMAGWREPHPFAPPTIAEAPKAAYDAPARLAWLDEQGIAGQVLYPNLLGFDSHAFLRLGTDAALACVRAYNDFLSEWCGADPARLIPVMSLPFWDMEAAVDELERCHDAGHKGILMAANYERAGFPNVASPEWAPVLAAAEERALSINFHIGFSKQTIDELEARYTRGGRARLQSLSEAEFEEHVIAGVASSAGSSFLSNSQAIADVICSGLCARYPDLKFVSVESGFGYIPFLLQALDWQWSNAGINRISSRFDLLPSEYFRRQIYGTFWFERPNVADLIDLQDNVMFETDYPHPTCLSRGPWSTSLSPRETIVEHMQQLPSDVRHKVLYANAAKLYGVSARPL
jgi:predicted TIM-barrel fold metal-dependent hydrolase